MIQNTIQLCLPSVFWRIYDPCLMRSYIVLHNRTWLWSKCSSVLQKQLLGLCGHNNMSHLDNRRNVRQAATNTTMSHPKTSAYLALLLAAIAWKAASYGIKKRQRATQWHLCVWQISWNESSSVVEAVFYPRPQTTRTYQHSSDTLFCRPKLKAPFLSFRSSNTLPSPDLMYDQGHYLRIILNTLVRVCVPSEPAWGILLQVWRARYKRQ